MYCAYDIGPTCVRVVWGRKLAECYAKKKTAHSLHKKGGKED